MNYETAILYAHQRMREIGKCPEDYHFEPVQVYPNAEDLANGYFSINAYNELYILVKPKDYYGLMIIADNSAYNCDSPIDSGIPEFTGQIRFYKIADEWNFDVGNSSGSGDIVMSSSPPSTTIVKRIPVKFLRVVIY